MVWCLNLLIPGAGLILLRREWLGFFLALMFGLCANLGMAGWLIAPDAIPLWMVRLAAGLSIALWIAAQSFLFRQIGWLDRRRSGLATLRAEASSALENGDPALARLALESGLEIDDCDPELLYLYARLCTIEQRDEQARGAWERVLRLDAPAAHRAEAAEYLRRFSVPE
jgi:hypothetical protein